MPKSGISIQVTQKIIPQNKNIADIQVNKGHTLWIVNSQKKTYENTINNFTRNKSGLLNKSKNIFFTHDIGKTGHSKKCKLLMRIFHDIRFSSFFFYDTKNTGHKTKVDKLDYTKIKNCIKGQDHQWKSHL